MAERCHALLPEIRTFSSYRAVNTSLLQKTSQRFALLGSYAALIGS